MEVTQKMILDYFFYEILNLDGGHYFSDKTTINEFKTIREDNCHQKDGQWIHSCIKINYQKAKQETGCSCLMDIPLDKLKEFEEIYETEINENEIYKKIDILNKVYLLFEVSLSPEDLELPIVEISSKISQKISPEVKKVLIDNYHKIILG